MDRIPFNKPYLTGKEAHYLYQAVNSGKISGNGLFTKKCHEYFKKKYNFKETFLTTSCTDALEMATILADIQPGDEVIMPSFTFVSTANAFVLRGAKIVFADSEKDTPNINNAGIEDLITEKTKAIVPVHYAGIACNMNGIMDIAKKHNLVVIEDAAQAINSFFQNIPLGSIGQMGAFSFHETKNIISGEGGMLTVNDENMARRAEIVWEKGTNRSAFFRGEVDKYGWMDIGSSFLPSDIIAAFLFAQLEQLEDIQNKRKSIWDQYYRSLKPLEAEGCFRLLKIPDYATNNAHLFNIICKNLEERTELLGFLKKQGIHAVFHYLSLHRSPYFMKKHDGRKLPMSDFYSDCLLRLPLFYELTDQDVQRIIDSIYQFYNIPRLN